MLKLDHLRIPVTNVARSRDWYVRTLGMKVETIFLQAASAPVVPGGCALWFQVADVEAVFAEWSARGVEFAHGPRRSYWGYGAELADPDGYLVRLWDERSMKEQ
jgi:catechol 2,3-dioxygenase-like lactoylglutathione lyase family enzyme